MTNSENNPNDGQKLIKCNTQTQPRNLFTPMNYIIRPASKKQSNISNLCIFQTEKVAGNPRNPVSSWQI